MNALYRAPTRANPVLSHSAERRTRLSGEWAFRLDPSWAESRYLLAQICRYAAGEAPSSAPELTEQAVDRLLLSSTAGA